MNRRLTPLAAALFAAFAAPIAMQSAAFAQTQPVETTLPEVKVRDAAANGDYAPAVSTVGGKVPTAIRDIPQSVTVINRAVLDAQGATTLTEALRNVPGITLGAGEGGVIGDNINIRGFSARTDIYLDGMRDRGQYARETFFLESVEVLKGPSSMLFGRGSTGGVINQVSKQAKLRNHNEVGLSVGTDAYYRATADVNRKLSDTSAFRVSALAHSNESTRDVIEAERYGVAPSLRFGIGTPTEITISSLHQRSEEIPDYGFPFTTGGTKANPDRPLDQDINNFYGFTDDRFDQDLDILNARVEHKFSPTLSLRSQMQYNNARVHAAPTVINGETGVRNRRERAFDDQSLSNQTDLIAKFDTGTVKHTLATGIEISRDDYENQGYTWSDQGPAQDFNNPVYGPMPSTAVQTQNATYVEGKADTLGIYVNDTLELNRQWKLVGGVRWERFAMDYDTINNASGATTTGLSRTDNMTSVRAGALYQPSDAESYYLSYGTSFNPSGEILTLSAGSNSSINGTAGLDPEKNRSLEVGAKWDLLGGGLSLTTALFRVEKTNARTTDPITRITTIDGRIRVDGLELSASGRITPNWQVFGGYTYLDGKVLEANEADTAGNRLPNTPEHSASVWSTYTFADVWEIGGGAVHAAKRFTNNQNTRVIDGYTRYDATVAYLQKNYDVRLNLQNLTDKAYFEAGSGRATPAKGRAAVVTVNYRF